MKILRTLSALIAVGAVIFLSFFSWTTQIRDKNGEIIEGSIAELEKVKIGGMEQWILIRGALPLGLPCFYFFRICRRI